MKLAIPKEIVEGEGRVAATPETVKKLLSLGLKVLIEKGAGEASLVTDEAYEKAGAQIISSARALYADCDIVLKVRIPSEDVNTRTHEADILKEGTLLIALLDPYRNLHTLEKLNLKKITLLAMEMIPRIARAQKIDALSSQSNIAGYKAVLMAADRLPKMMPLMMTAAGTVTPAKVFVIGAGVAGLQAIATAKRLGAQVEAFDTRPAVKEQVESLGAKFVSMELDAGDTEDKGGYAKELSKEAHDKEKDFLSKHVAGSDIVITTALIPGRPAPRLITREMVRGMKPGSVIVDLAAEGGGNCDVTVPCKEVVLGGVRVLGHVNIPSLLAHQASELLSRNISGLFLEIFKDGKINLDLNNDVIKGALIAQDGRIVSEPIGKAMKARKD